MAGAQYQGCNVNGYYKLVDGTGDLLFEIGSVNFGGSNSHQFCLSQTQIDDDAGITAIIAPQLMVCSPSVTPIVELKNFGANTLTSVDILYSIGGTSQTFSWTGNLASQQTTNVTLPAIVSSAGAQTFSAETNNPNGQTDQNQANDDESRSIFANFTAQQLPFIEDFENNAQGWFISNPDNSITWELAQVGGITPGNVAAKMDFFNYQEVNRRDGFISPKISLQGVSSAEMTFDHAYRRAQQSANDSLIIYVSTDCTASWTRVAGWAEDGSGTFATQTTSTAMFTPSSPIDWCFQPISQQTPGASCFTVNLDAFVGNDIFVMFEAYNAGNNGNNLYIDNINITGVSTGNTPVPNFTTDVNQICVGDGVQFTDASTENPTSWNWTFPGGTPATSTSQNPNVTYNSSGTYDVILEVTNQHGTQTQTFTNVVTVVSVPTVTATASETSICAGESVTLTAGGASSYTWDNGLGSGSTQTVSPTITTTYQVNGTSGNCSGSASVTVSVNPSPATPVIVQNGNVLSVNIQAGETAVWLLEGNVVGSGSSITITSDGNYEVRVTNADGCSSSTSSYFTVESSSIGVNNFGDQFNVYPNPTENIVNISWSGANRVKSVHLYDAQGRIIQNQIVYDEEGIELDLTRYQTGVYIVRLETENGVYSKKVTKR